MNYVILFVEFHNYHKDQYLALCYLCYVNDIQNCATNISVKLFADDTNVFIHRKSVEQTTTTVM